MDKIVNIQNINPTNFQLQSYSSADESLILNTTTNITFDPTQDYIEYLILDLNKNILFSNTAGYPNYRIQDTVVKIDPQIDLEIQGFNEGQYYTIYNFFKRKLSSSPNSTLYIQDISTDRTELRLNTTAISNLELINLTNEFTTEISLSPYQYVDFYLNFGDNKLLIANNIALDNSIPNDPTVLIKLYEPLPVDFNIQSQCWVVEQVAESKAYQIELTTVFNFTEQLNYIGSPNFNLDVQDQINNSTAYANKTTLSQNSSVVGSGSLLYQINSILADKGIEINVDYSEYSNFVHFSSAQTRLENFYYKLALIEEYTVSSSFSNPSSSISSNSFTTASQAIWDNKINDIITHFDGYEYYLYYTSESHAWPKTNSIAPYLNYSTTSSTAINWFTSQSYSASYFDSENNNALLNVIPTYLREDPNNDQYFLFVQMIGQHFDNIWIYLKDITNKFDADNRLDYGISKDIIAQAIRDLGVKIYQNNFSTDDLYAAFLGITPDGGYMLNTSGELITNYVTASATSSLIPLNDINAETYKRIYHNIPYLLKKKGTIEGLRTLITLYGIPDTILRINEYGGKDKNNSNDWDYFQNQFNYEFYSTGSGYITFDVVDNSYYGWAYYEGDVYGPVSINPEDSLSFEVRFKTTGIPTTSSFSQSLAYISPSSSLNLVLEYTGSGYASASYAGSIPDLYNQYATLKLINNVTNTSASVYLPFFDGDWWSVLVTVDSSSVYTNSLFAKNKIYDGYDGSQIGFQASSSFTSSQHWITISGSNKFYLSSPTNRTIAGKTYTPFSGSFQELRMYNIAISESVFDDYVMNPYSIEGNQLMGSQSSLNSLIFRAPLGSVLDNDSSTTRISLHPSYTTYPSTGSWAASGSLYYLSGSYSFLTNRETIYFDQFPAGVKNAISDKIKIVDNILPDGDTLSSFISIQQSFPISESYTKDTNYLEVAFSPQNEINDDIIAQLGYFNIGDYIGDPRQLINTNATQYPDFNKIRDMYFSKYQGRYDLKDYVRLIKYFDNSLFKLIKDFTPARTNLASGVVIKQHLLERNRYSPAQTSYEFHNEFSASVKSFPYDYAEDKLYKVEGDSGGGFPTLGESNSSSFLYPGAINITQSWTSEFDGPKGLSYISHSYKDEFYTGELKGTEIPVALKSLSIGATLFNNIFLSKLTPVLYKIDNIPNTNFYNSNTAPEQGEVLIFIDQIIY
jgi:hypothetical protein